MRSWTWARSVLSVAAGYAAVVVITSLTFDTVLGGFRYHGSSAVERTIGAAGALLAGLAGGWLAASLAGRQPLAHAAGVLVPLALDTAYVLLVWRPRLPLPDPLWFDLVGSAILMVAALAGGLLCASEHARWRWSAPARAAR